MSRTAQNARVLESAVNDLRLHKLPRVSRPVVPAFKLTPAEQARADAEWSAMDRLGRLK